MLVCGGGDGGGGGGGVWHVGRMAGGIVTIDQERCVYAMRSETRACVRRRCAFTVVCTVVLKFHKFYFFQSLGTKKWLNNYEGYVISTLYTVSILHTPRRRGSCAI